MRTQSNNGFLEPKFGEHDTQLTLSSFSTLNFPAYLFVSFPPSGKLLIIATTSEESIQTRRLAYYMH